MSLNNLWRLSQVQPGNRMLMLGTDTWNLHRLIEQTLNSIHLLIITTDSITLYLLLDMLFSLSLHFLPVLSLETSVCSTLKFYPVYLWS